MDNLLWYSFWVLSEPFLGFHRTMPWHERAPQDNFYDVISKVNLVFHVHQGTYQSG
jgi:hypothetical protein